MTTRNQIKRSILLDLLEAWRAGEINERQIHESAESMMDEVAEMPNYEDSDPNSIPLEVLVHLDALNHQLITADELA